MSDPDPDKKDTDLNPRSVCLGALYDSIGDFDAGFYFSGTMIFLSGIMLFAIPSMQRQAQTNTAPPPSHPPPVV